MSNWYFRFGISCSANKECEIPLIFAMNKIYLESKYMWLMSFVSDHKYFFHWSFHNNVFSHLWQIFNVHMASQYTQYIMHDNLVFRVLQTKSVKYLWFLMHKYLILIRIKSYTSSSIVMHLSFVENSGLEFQVMEEFWCPNLIFPMC